MSHLKVITKLRYRGRLTDEHLKYWRPAPK